MWLVVSGWGWVDPWVEMSDDTLDEGSETVSDEAFPLDSLDIRRPVPGRIRHAGYVAEYVVAYGVVAEPVGEVEQV